MFGQNPQWKSCSPCNKQIMDNLKRYMKKAVKYETKGFKFSPNKRRKRKGIHAKSKMSKLKSSQNYYKNTKDREGEKVCKNIYGLSRLL